MRSAYTLNGYLTWEQIVKKYEQFGGRRNTIPWDLYVEWIMFHRFVDIRYNCNKSIVSECTHENIRIAIGIPGDVLFERYSELRLLVVKKIELLLEHATNERFWKYNALINILDKLPQAEKDIIAPIVHKFDTKFLNLQSQKIECLTPPEIPQMHPNSTIRQIGIPIVGKSRSIDKSKKHSSRSSAKYTDSRPKNNPTYDRERDREYNDLNNKYKKLKNIHKRDEEKREKYEQERDQEYQDLYHKYEDLKNARTKDEEKREKYDRERDREHNELCDQYTALKKSYQNFRESTSFQIQKEKGRSYGYKSLYRELMMERDELRNQISVIDKQKTQIEENLAHTKILVKDLLQTRKSTQPSSTLLQNTPPIFKFTTQSQAIQTSGTNSCFQYDQSRVVDNFFDSLNPK